MLSFTLSNFGPMDHDPNQAQSTQYPGHVGSLDLVHVQPPLAGLTNPKHGDHCPLSEGHPINSNESNILNRQLSRKMFNDHEILHQEIPKNGA